jgi:large repetitive protein
LGQRCCWTSTDHSVIKDNTNPAVTVTAPATGGYQGGQGNITITWSATDTNIAATPITLEYSPDGGSSWNSIATGEVNDGTYTWNSPGFDGADYRIRVTAIDLAGNSTATGQSSSWTMDSTDPAATSASFILNGGSATTITNFINAAFNATDNLSTAAQFCLQETSTTTPSTGDSCWTDFASIGVTASNSVAVTTNNHQLPFANGVYNVYLFIKDGVGNISDLTNAGAGTDGQDKDDITFTPGNAPVVQDILVANSDAPSNPPTSGDKTVTSSSDLFIKWKATDVEDVDSTLTINLYYSTNDTTWTSISAGLINGQNGACLVNNGGTTADDTATGCYKWSSGSPTSNFYRVKVEVVDSASGQTYTTSDTINISFLRTIAGKTDDGLNASATSATILTRSPTDQIADTHSMVVKSDGTIFLRDINKGILKIDPTTGLLTIYIPYTGAYSGEGGAPTSATLAYIDGIVMDYSDNLYIRSADRILKVDFTANTITTWIGGGSDHSDTVANPTDVVIWKTYNYNLNVADWGPLFFTPNGDFYFQSDEFRYAIFDGADGDPNKKSRVRKYVASSGQVTSIDPTGIGTLAYPAQDISLCRIFNFGVRFNPADSSLTHAMVMVNGRSNYGGTPTGCTALQAPTDMVSMNPSTFVSLGQAGAVALPYANNWVANGARMVQGMNGELYAISQAAAEIKKYNTSTNSFDVIIGAGTRGTCADGTAATSCRISPWDLFVSTTGTIYLLDNGVVRTIDASGNIQTLYLQSLSYGDGGLATNARFNQVKNLKMWRDGATDKIVLFDMAEKRVREFPVDGNVSTIVGDGSDESISIGGSITGTMSVGTYPHIGLDSSGNIYSYRPGLFVYTANRSTGLWEHWLGNYSGTLYTVADGLSDIALSNTYPPNFIGYNGTEFLVAKHRYDGTYKDSFLKTYNVATAVQSHVAGVAGIMQSANLFDCSNGSALSTCPFIGTSPYNLFTWPWDSNNNRYIGGILATKEVFSVAAGGNKTVIFTATQNVSALAYDPNDNDIYYCSEDTGFIYKYDVDTTTETQLAWPILAMACYRNTMVFNVNGDGGNGSLIFGYFQNNLFAVGEYLNP